MAEVLLFHHAQGLTAGVLAFADQLRSADHVVHVPDLYDGKTFAVLTEGVGCAKQVGFGTIGERGRRAADGLPSRCGCTCTPEIGISSSTTACPTTSRAPRLCEPHRGRPPAPTRLSP